MRRKKEVGKTSILIVQEIPIEITRKKIKTIRLRVNRISKKVKVSCPYQVKEKEIVEFVEKKMSWIQKHLSKETVIPSAKVNNYLDGDKVNFIGQTYTLELQSNSKRIDVTVTGKKIILSSGKVLTIARKEKAIQEFYRAYLKNEIPKLIEKWEPIMGVSVAEFGVKRMKTRWGTCNIRDRRIWLSLALAEKSPELLEYVVVHEMVHLLERLHNQRFKNFMTQFLPNWKELQNQLNGRID